MNSTPTVAPHLADIAAKLQDPVVVHAAMLRGEIAKPAIRDMLHLYGADALARWDAAESLVLASNPLSAPCGCGAGTVADCLAESCEKVQARIAADAAQPAAAPVGHYTPEKLRAEAVAQGEAP